MTTYSLNRFGYVGIYMIVFVTGAAVMVIELLGTRLIAPFYGASLYVWSSLISVAMIALAAGYFTGGRLADAAKRSVLSLIIALAALLTLLIPWLTRTVLLATDSLGLRAGAFVSALALFSPSLTFLGMVGPFAIKLSTTQMEGVGTSAGSIYAVSTLGSVVGTLVLGFFLFPLVGSRQILFGLSAILFLLAFGVAVIERKHLGIKAAVVSGILLASIGLGLAPGTGDAGPVAPGGVFRTRSAQESLYGWVRVIDQPAKDLRLLTSDASTIGAASISSGNSRLGYQDIVHLIPALVPDMKRALLIGLGAGHMATTLHQGYGIATDTLEIDPAVAKAASDYFNFQPTGRFIVGDARYEIRRLKGPYDLIIHDCFTGGSEAAHLLTVETLTRLRDLLSDGGVLTLNFVAFLEQGENKALASVARTLAQVFPHQSVFASEPGDEFNDFIFLAVRRRIDLHSPLLGPGQTDWLRARLIRVNQARGTILTDNFNPLEKMQTRQACRYLVIDFGTSKSPKSTRQRDNHYAPTALRPCRFATPSQARRWLRSTPSNGLTACRM